MIMIIDETGIWGVDISKYQADPITKVEMDFKKLKEAGASFVIPKIGQYNYYDYHAEYNWRTAKEYGFSRGAYWFLDYRDKGKAQAQKFFDFFVKHGFGEGIYFVDYENGSGGDWQMVYDFIVEFQRLSGLPNDKIGVYSAYFYWIENSPFSIEQRRWFAQFPYWHAWYLSNAPSTSVKDILSFYLKNASGVRVPPQWINPPSPLLWQAGTPAIGRMLGAVSREIDFNIFNGDAILFEKYFGTKIDVPPVEPPPVGGNEMYNLIVLAAYLNGRGTPSPTGALVFPAGTAYSSGFRKDDLLEASEKVRVGTMDWYRITKCTRKDGAGNPTTVQIPDPVWAGAGETYGLMRLYTPEPPEQPETPEREIYMKFSETGETYKYVLVE